MKNYDRDVITERQLPNSPEWDGDLVYFVGCPETKRVKIGKSTNAAFRQRFQDLQMASYEELHVFGIAKGSYKKETALHKKFSKYHVRGEWFELSEEIDIYIENETVEFIPMSKLRRS